MLSLLLSSTGSIAERVSQGVANFSTLTSYCAPGDELTVVLGVEALAVEDLNYHAAFSHAVTFSFRECVRGEILEKGYCHPCPAGSYTFEAYSDTAGCLECPENALCPGGDVVEVDEGG